MLILYVILVLCTVAVVGVAFACWRLVQKHLRSSHAEIAEAAIPAVSTAGSDGHDIQDWQ